MKSTSVALIRVEKEQDVPENGKARRRRSNTASISICLVVPIFVSNKDNELSSSYMTKCRRTCQR